MWSCESLTNIYTSIYCSSWFTYERYFDQSIQFVQVKNTLIYTLHFDQKLVGLQLCFSFFNVFLCRKPFFLASEKNGSHLRSTDLVPNLRWQEHHPGGTLRQETQCSPWWFGRMTFFLAFVSKSVRNKKNLQPGKYRCTNVFFYDHVRDLICRLFWSQNDFFVHMIIMNIHISYSGHLELTRKQLKMSKSYQTLLYWTFCTAKEVLTVRTTLAANGCYGDGHSRGCGIPFGKLWEARRLTFRMFSEVTEVSKHSTERPGMVVTKPRWISTNKKWYIPQWWV